MNFCVCQEGALPGVAQQNLQQLDKMLPLICCLAGPKASKEQHWTEVFRFMDQTMPAETGDCSLDRLTEDVYTAVTYAGQVLSDCQPWLLLGTEAPVMTPDGADFSCLSQSIQL